MQAIAVVLALVSVQVAFFVPAAVSPIAFVALAAILIALSTLVVAFDVVVAVL